MSIVLLSRQSEVEPFVDRVRAAADTERGSFGFLPKNAYDEFAAQGRMIVAVESGTQNMLGYVLYGGAMPQGKIFQTWTARQSRGQGVGRRLILDVVRRLEQLSYLSVRADVARDLDGANEFYAALGFEIVTTRPAKTPGRHINVRVRELATPSLIELAVAQTDRHICLPLVLPASSRIPLYVLDLNVLFDVARARTQASHSGKVFGAGLENDVRLAVSAELVQELKRNTDPAAPDPILEFAASLPRLPLPPRPVRETLATELAPAIFPDRTKAGRLKLQDKSDLIHLATAIHESAAGFITSEKAILRASDLLRANYRLEVLSPEAFGMTLGPEATETDPIHVRACGSGVRAHTIAEHDYEEAERFLGQRNLTSSEVRTILASGTENLPRRRFMVRVDGTVAAVAAWDAPRAAEAVRRLQVYVDEGSAAASVASDYLIRRAIADVGAASPSVVELVTRSGQTSVRQAALTNGFFRAHTGRSLSERLQKVAVARAITPECWRGLRESVRARAGIRLPDEVPAFRGSAQTLTVTNERGECVTLPLSDLERLLSPLLLVLPERPAVILPITERYAEELFSGSAQLGLLAGREASLRSVRGYIGGRGTYNIVPEGGLAVFYESGRGRGRMAATAVARVTRRYLMDKEVAIGTLANKAVLEAETVRDLGRGEQVVVTEFEDLMLLRQPVRLSALRNLGCADGANLVTARRLTSDQVTEIVRAGQPHA